MGDYLSDLVSKNFGPADAIKPRLAGRFEPVRETAAPEFFETADQVESAPTAAAPPREKDHSLPSQNEPYTRTPSQTPPASRQHFSSHFQAPIASEAEDIARPAAGRITETGSPDTVHQSFQADIPDRPDRVAISDHDLSVRGEVANITADVIADAATGQETEIARRVETGPAIPSLVTSVTGVEETETIFPESPGEIRQVSFAERQRGTVSEIAEAAPGDGGEIVPEIAVQSFPAQNFSAQPDGPRNSDLIPESAAEIFPAEFAETGTPPEAVKTAQPRRVERNIFAAPENTEIIENAETVETGVRKNDDAIVVKPRVAAAKDSGKNEAPDLSSPRQNPPQTPSQTPSQTPGGTFFAGQPPESLSGILSGRRSEQPAGAAPEPPTINVTIGRVEVRAVTPPASPRRERPGRSQALSLDEYLQKRGGKR